MVAKIRTTTTELWSRVGWHKIDGGKDHHKDHQDIGSNGRSIAGQAVAASRHKVEGDNYSTNNFTATDYVLECQLYIVIYQIQVENTALKGISVPMNDLVVIEWHFSNTHHFASIHDKARWLTHVQVKSYSKCITAAHLSCYSLWGIFSHHCCYFIQQLETKASSHQGQCLPAGSSVSSPRLVLLTMSIIAMRSRLFAANSASVCLRTTQQKQRSYCQLNTQSNSDVYRLHGSVCALWTLAEL